VVEAVRRAMEVAPSVCNRQGGRVYMLTSEAGKRAALSFQNGNRGWGHEAGVVLVMAASQEHYVLMREERYQAWIDGGMWSQAVLMGLHSVGLGACPLNWDVTPAVDMKMREAVGISPADTILMLVAVGHYPSTFDVAASPRKPLADVLYPEAIFFPPRPPRKAALETTTPLQRRGVCNGTVYIVPPGNAVPNGLGSIGDRAVTTVAYQQLRRHCGPHVTIQCDSCELAHLPYGDLVQRSSPHGPLRRWHKLQPQEIASLLKTIGSVWILATDCIDGRYGMDMHKEVTKMMPHIVAAKVPTALISFSYDTALSQAMHDLPSQSCVRPRSFKSCERFRDPATVQVASSGVENLIPVLGNEAKVRLTALVGPGQLPHGRGIPKKLKAAKKSLVGSGRNAGRVLSQASKPSHRSPKQEMGKSLQRLSAASHVRNTMDMALLIQSAAPRRASMQASLRWVRVQKSSGRIVLAANFFVYESTVSIGKPSGSAATDTKLASRPHSMREHAIFFAQALCDSAKNLPLSFLMVPHDFRRGRMRGRGYEDESAYLRDVATRMVHLCDAHVHLINNGTQYEPTESAYILKYADGTVSGLMHLLILSASVATPGLALVNQEKFVAFQHSIYPVDAAHVGSDNCVHDFTAPGVLAAAVKRFVRARARHKRELASRLPHMKLLAARNFDMLWNGECSAGMSCNFE